MERLGGDVQRLLGLQLTSEQNRAFQIYYQELKTWNARFNLTAITDPEGVQIRHFLDSLSCLLAVDANLRGQCLIDVGSGLESDTAGSHAQKNGLFATHSRTLETKRREHYPRPSRTDRPSAPTS